MIEPTSLPDRILARLGKRRAVHFPDARLTYGYYVARREGFFRALFRRKGHPLPDGWVYWDVKEERSGE